MKEENAPAAVLFIVVVLGVVSLLVILTGEELNVANVVSGGAEKRVINAAQPIGECKIPTSMIDLFEAASEIKNVPISSDTCLLVAQRFCQELPAGTCSQQCWTHVQSAEGPCGATAASRITGQVVQAAECLPLAMGYDVKATKFLTYVGGEAQTVPATNPCKGGSQTSTAKVYSSDEPLQAYARNVFESGDIVGYVLDNNQPSIEYVICKDSGARVTSEGSVRCDTI